MAEVTIRFRSNPRTGKRELVVSYTSDEDALAHEHERDHRALVERLLGVPVTEDMGDIVVERVDKRPAGESSAEASDPAVARTKLGQGS
jgi:hypothetical protein